MTLFEDILTKFSVKRDDSARTPGYRPIMVIQSANPIEVVTGRKEIFELVFDVQPREEIKVSGSQNIAIFQNPGGRSALQPVGPETAFVSWNGLLLGPAAFDNANNLAKLRDAGASVFVLFGPLSKKAVIKYFNYSIRTFELISYQIGVYIEQDLDDITYYTKFEPVVLKALPDWARGYGELYNAVGKVSGTIAGTLRDVTRLTFWFNNSLDRQIEAWGRLADIPVSELKALSLQIKSMNQILSGARTNIYGNYIFQSYRESMGYTTTPSTAEEWQ